MHISILLMEQIIELFIMIFMGFIIVKTGIVKDEDSKVLSKIVLYLIIPCVIINAFQVDYTSKTVRGLLIAFAVAMDIDAAGLPFLKNLDPPAGSKTVSELCDIIQMAGTPFIVKGIMTVKGALKAKEAGASAIIV